MVELDATKSYEQLLPEAQVLAASEIVPYRIVADLAIANVKTAMEFFATVEGQVGEYLPKEDFGALKSLPDLALAVKYAAMLVEQQINSESEVEKRTSEGWQLRNQLLSTAKALVAVGLMPSDEVKAIASGRGTRDMAEDCVNLAELFRTNAPAIAGKHAIEAGQIERAALVGSFLMQHLRPKNAPVGNNHEPVAVVDARDRLATLLTKRYERMRAVAHYFLGDGWEEKVPALMSRQVEKKAQTAEV